MHRFDFQFNLDGVKRYKLTVTFKYFKVSDHYKTN